MEVIDINARICSSLQLDYLVIFLKRVNIDKFFQHALFPSELPEILLLFNLNLKRERILELDCDKILNFITILSILFV